jgi:prepilin-type N-terminal cleavage/methylation domain-containing protein
MMEMKGMKMFPKKGFTLIEAVLVMMLVAVAYFGFGLLFGNVEQNALQSDLTVLAVKLAREKMETIVHTKAYSGYSAVVSEPPATVPSGSWNFTVGVNVSNVNPDMSQAATDTGYKKVVVTSSWGAGAGDSIALTTLVTNMSPQGVHGIGYGQCP